MNGITFDTHGFVKNLTNAGVPERHAEAIVGAMKEAHTANLDDLVTKYDLEATKHDLELAIAKLKTELLMWVIPMLLGQVAVFAAVVKWL